MAADLEFNGVRVSAVPIGTRLRVPIPTVLTVTIFPHNAGAVRWISDNDPVLAIKDEGLAVATLEATKQGRSFVSARQNGRTLMSLLVEVYEQGAAQLVPSVGEVEPK